MKQLMKNKRGFALVYALVVLLLATVGGTALLFLSRKDHINATDYSGMRIASLAAETAIRACEGQFLTNPNEALLILKKYLANPSAKTWLLGTAANAGTEQKITLGGGTRPSQYSARIVGYDTNSQYIIIEGNGYLSNGGRKRVIGAYQLAGLGLSDIPFTMNFGLFMGGQLENCNDPIRIEGNVYISGQCSDPIAWGLNKQHFNQGGIINGDLKTAQSIFFLEVKDLTVTGNVLMQLGCWPNSGASTYTFTIKKNAGFTYDFYNMDGTIKIEGDAYFKPATNLPKDNKIEGTSGHTVRYSSPATASKFTGFGTETSTSLTTNSIASALGMSAAAEAPFGLNLPASWGTGVVQNISGNLSDLTLDSCWTAHRDSQTLYQNEWLVLQLTGDVKILGGSFTRKAIWITGDYGIDGQENFYNCSNESNTLIIVNGSNGKLWNMGPGDNCNFRGMIYVNTTYPYQMIYQFGSNSIFYGAIHHASQTKFNLNGGDADTVRIYINNPIAQSALQEIVNTGIILAPGVTTPPPRTMVLKDVKIRPTLQFMQL